MKPVLFFFLVMVMASVTAQKPVSAKIAFKIKNMGITVDGTMEVTDLRFKQPSADPATWTLEGTASPATINTGIGIRDKHLKRSDYFDVEKFPVIRLASSRIKPNGRNKYEGTFTLTIKSISKTATIPFTISENGMTGEFTINRLDYGLGEKSAILSNDVKIKVTGVFSAR